MIVEVEHSEYAPAGAGRLVLLVRGRAWDADGGTLAPPTLLVRTAAGERRVAAAPGSRAIRTDAARWVPFTVPYGLDARIADADPTFALDPGRAGAAPAGQPVEHPLLSALERSAAELDAIADTLPGLESQLDAIVRAARARRSAAAQERQRLQAQIAQLQSQLASRAPAPQRAPPAPPPSPAPQPRAAPVPRPRRHRLLPTLPVALFTVGSLAVADAVMTVVWKEPISSIYQARKQAGLTDDLERLDVKLAEVRVQLPAIPSPAERMAALARRLDRDARAGDALGRLEIPKLDQSFVVVHGTGDEELRTGPGHYSASPLPGGRGTVGVAGHRTTYGAPFRNVDRLRRGDTLRMRMPYGDFEYRVEGTRIVAPTETSVLRTVKRDRLVLTACHPLYSAKERIIVFAVLRRATPKGPALKLGTSAA